MTDRQELETGSDDLLAWVDGGVAVVSFNRPSARNALSEGVYRGFAAVLPEVARRGDIGCLVITGEGGAFCAGGDINGMVRPKSAQGPGGSSREAAIDDFRIRHRQVSLAIHELPKPTVAAIPGPAAGAGLSIALSCDLRIASQRAILTTAFAKIGASGDFGGSWFLTQLVGSSRALQLYLLSDRLSADEALALGVVNFVAPDAEFADAWMALGRRLAAGPTLAFRYIKENVNRAAAGGDLVACLDAEASAMVTTMRSADHREAATAFLEKRDPTFIGR